MPTNTDLTPSSATPARSDATDRPIVYLANADGEQGMRINLPILLAPIWRWRWMVIAILALTVITAGWIWTRPAQTMHQFVIRRGIIGAEHFRSQLESLIIPGALNAMDPDWRPDIEITDRKSAETFTGFGASPEASLSTLSFPIHATDAEVTSKLSSLLRERIETLARDSTPIATVEDQSLRLAFKQAVSRAQHAYEVVSDEGYVDVLRGELDRDIALTTSGIRRQQASLVSLSQRYESLAGRMTLLQGLLENLLNSMDDTTTAYPGMAQVVADRVTSMRMELEIQIPAERVLLLQSIEEAQARMDQLEADLTQQRLQANTFDTDMAEQQTNAQLDIESAVASLTKYQAQSAAKLVAQPLAIVEEFDLVEKRNPLLVTLATLFIGCLLSLLSAYVLEAIRLARIGALQE